MYACSSAAPLSARRTTPVNSKQCPNDRLQLRLAAARVGNMTGFHFKRGKGANVRLGNKRSSSSQAARANPPADSNAEAKAPSQAPVPLVRIDFLVPSYRVGFGDSVRIVGEREELGGWDPSRGLALEWSEGDLWRASVRFTPGPLSFKVVTVRHAGIVEWEGGDNRCVALSDPGPGLAAGNAVRVICSPGETPATLVWTEGEVEEGQVGAQGGEVQEASQQKQTQQRQAQAQQAQGKVKSACVGADNSTSSPAFATCNAGSKADVAGEEDVDGNGSSAAPRQAQSAVWERHPGNNVGPEPHDEKRLPWYITTSVWESESNGSTDEECEGVRVPGSHLHFVEGPLHPAVTPSMMRTAGGEVCSHRRRNGPAPAAAGGVPEQEAQGAGEEAGAVASQHALQPEFPGLAELDVAADGTLTFYFKEGSTPSASELAERYILPLLPPETRAALNDRRRASP